MNNAASNELITFDVNMSAQFIKFEATSEHNEIFYASLAEFGLYYQAPCSGVITNVKSGDVKVSPKVFPTLVEAGGVITITAYQGVVRVFNLSGQLVVESVRVDNFAVIPTDGLKAGVYFIQSLDGVIQEKVVLK